MNVKYVVKLNQQERHDLRTLLSRGTAPARKLTRARILLMADASNGKRWLDKDISEALDIGVSTIGRVKRRCVQEGLEAALNRRERCRNTPRKLDGEQEAHLIALACSEPPQGRQRWTLRLLADKMVQLQHVDSVSHETVRQVLKKTRPSPG